MKTLSQTRKREEAITPVIATILLVAITVVLAAVLWAMASLILVDNEQPVYLSFTKRETMDNWTVSVNSISDEILLRDVKVAVLYENATSALTSRAMSELVSGIYYNGIRFQDITEPGYLSVGDMITFDREIYGEDTSIIFTSLSGRTTYGAETVG